MPAVPVLTAALHTAPRLLLAAAVLGAAGGCALIEPDDRSQANGDAARGLLAQQLLRPEAPVKNAGLVPPTNGRITRETADRLLNTYKEPPAPSNVITIGVGGR